MALPGKIAWKEEVRRRLVNLELSPVREAEIVEELAQHLEDGYDEFVAGGASHEEAADAALAELSESDLSHLERSVSQQSAGDHTATRGRGTFDAWRQSRQVDETIDY